MCVLESKGVVPAGSIEFELRLSKRIGYGISNWTE
jgi:hypothetical protein